MICDHCFLYPFKDSLPYGWCCPDPIDYCVDYIPVDGPLTSQELDYLFRLGLMFFEPADCDALPF